MMENKTYIGDGVYASFDGFQILLETDRSGYTDKIYLEPNVLERFLEVAGKYLNLTITITKTKGDK